MQKIMLFLCSSMLLAAPAVWAGDVTVKGQGSDVTVSGNSPGDVTIKQNPSGIATPMAANPQLGAQWTMLQGEVMNADQQARTLTLKLKGSDSVVAVPADPAYVAIYKKGDHRFDLR